MSVEMSWSIAEYFSSEALFLVPVLLSLNPSSVLDLSGLYCFRPVDPNIYIECGSDKILCCTGFF